MIQNIANSQNFIAESIPSPADTSRIAFKFSFEVNIPATSSTKLATLRSEQEH